MIEAVHAAVQRIERRAFRAQPDDEAIGARRRPWLDDTHRLDVRPLHWLLEREARAQTRRHPIGRIDLGHHAAAIGRLAQDEFDELGPCGEGC